MPLLVRRSRLGIGSDSSKFPTVSGFNLDRQELEFPRDLGGDLNLLFVPFLQYQQTIVNTWIPLADTLESSFREFAYYELPTINELPALWRERLRPICGVMRRMRHAGNFLTEESGSSTTTGRACAARWASRRLTSCASILKTFPLGADS